MPLISDEYALQIRAALVPLAELKKVTELAVVTVKTAAGIAITGLENLPATLDTNAVLNRSPDQDQQVEAIIIVRRDELPEVIPAIDRTMRVTVMFAGRTATYMPLRFVPHSRLGTSYRLELRRVQGAVYG